MQELTPESPLMQPVEWHSEMYLTSHYFHHQYLTNSPKGGKYTRHADFLRVLRSIEAYRVYVAQGDIVELTMAHVKAEGTHNLRYFQALFQAAGWRLLVLLNTTAQIALSHHLEDEA